MTWDMQAFLLQCYCCFLRGAQNTKAGQCSWHIAHLISSVFWNFLWDGFKEPRAIPRLSAEPEWLPKCSDPHSPEDLVGPPHCKAPCSPFSSGTVLFIFSLQHFQSIFLLSGLSSLSFVNCLIWGISEAGGLSALGCVLMVSQKCKSCM